MRRITALVLVLVLLLSGCAHEPENTSEPMPSVLPSAEPSGEPSPEVSPDDETEALQAALRKNLTVAGKTLSVDFMLIVDGDGRTRWNEFHGVYGGLPECWVKSIDDFKPVYDLEPKEIVTEGFQEDVGGHTADTSQPGRYFYTADVRYEFDSGYTASVTYNVWVNIQGEPELTLGAETVRQGDMLAVTATGAVALDGAICRSDGPLDYPKYDPLTAEGCEFEIYLPHTDTTQPCTVVDGKLYAVAQISVAAPTGDFTMELRRSKDGGEPETIATADYTIEAREFERQDLVTTSSTQSIYTSENLDSDNEKMRAARSNSNPEPYFTGKFSCPLPEGYVITTDFGQQRYVGGKFQSRHCAYDMAIAADTDVYATAPGVVTFADELIVSGNTVVIDHGAGIFSSYSHLNSINVEEGDFVEQGAVIGLVGSTGYSTGPHLHFGMVASGYYVDPFYPQEHDLLAVFNDLTSEE